MVDKPVYAIFGDEPYMIDGYKKAIVKGLASPELDVGKYGKFSGEVADFLSAVSFFGGRKVAFVQASSFKELAEPGIKEYLKNPVNGNTLVFLVSDVDKRTAAYKEFEKKGWNLHCDKLNVKQLQGVLVKHVQDLGGTITEDAYKEFMAREAYFDQETVTVYDLMADLSKLVQIESKITVDTVSSLIKKNVTDDTWGIVKMVCENDVTGLMEQAEVLGSDAIRVLSAVLREYRMAYKSLYFDKKEIGVNQIMLSGMPRNQIVESIRIITDTISGLKFGYPGNALSDVFMRLVALQRKAS